MPTATAASAAIRCACSTARTPRCRSSSRGAPLLTEHLDAESREHFEALCAHARCGRRVPTRSIRAWCAVSTTTTAPCSNGSPILQRRPECRMLRRPLRRPDRAARRRCDSGGRFCDGGGAAGGAAGGRRRHGGARAARCLRGGRRRRSRGAGAAARRAAAQRAPAAALRAECRRRQLQDPVPPRRPQRRGAGAGPRRGRAGARRGRQ